MSFEAFMEVSERRLLPKAYRTLEAHGFERCAPSLFWHPAAAIRAYNWYEQDRYLSHSGVYAQAMKHDVQFMIYIRTNISASYSDVEKQNMILRSLRKELELSFSSDFGTNRYFPLPKWNPSPLESGCYLSLMQLDGNLSRLHIYLASPLSAGNDIDLMQDISPKRLSYAFVITFAVSALEEFWRSLYLALLRYGNHREVALHRARLTGNQIVRIADGTTTIEEAVVESSSFQSIKRAGDNLRTVEPDLNLHGLLSYPFGRRRLSPWQAIENLVALRHAFVHRGLQTGEMSRNTVEQILSQIREAAQRVRVRLIEIHGWNDLPSV